MSIDESDKIAFEIMQYTNIERKAKEKNMYRCNWEGKRTSTFECIKLSRIQNYTVVEM